MTLTMARRAAHRYADQDTPERVNIPDSAFGLCVWALGRHGPIVLFVVSTWFLYQDNKISQAQILEVAKQQIVINSQMITEMNGLQLAVKALVEEAQRAHKAPR